MNTANLDLNQLVALQALLDERSVTRAALRLGYSQPSLSASLAKLRRQFHDDLLIREGNRYSLSPLALRLREQVDTILTGVERLFETEQEFDPTATEREFTLTSSDYALAVLGAALGTALHDHAPQARLRIENISVNAVDNAAEYLRTRDGLLMPHGFIGNDLRHVDLFRDQWMVIAAADNSQLGDELTLDDLAQLPWVMTYHTATAFTPAARQLQLIGVEPHIQTVVDTFLALPYLVAGTSRIALIQGLLAQRVSEVSALRVLPCPFEVVPLVEALWWHPMYDHDPGHVWMRSILIEAGKRLTAQAAQPLPVR